MDYPQPHLRQMMALIMGAAWADGRLSPAEVEYLQKLLAQYHLDHDPELLALLKTPLPLDATEALIATYLANSTESERQKLLVDIGTLLIADDVISPQEHQLLDDYYTLMAEIPPLSEPGPALTTTIGQHIRRGLKTLLTKIHLPS
jgi:uncharacterized tellurite resistance protein B-like protein